MGLPRRSCWQGAADVQHGNCLWRLSVITSVDRYNVKYAIQDEEEHRTKELIVPPHAEIYLMVFKNRLGFTQTHFTFYFDGDRTKNPIIREWFSPLSKKEKTENPPALTSLIT